jgi:hypothetical protein
VVVVGGGGVVAGVPDGGGISELREPHRPKDDCFIAFKMFSFHTTLAHGDVLIHFKNRKTHDKFFGVRFFLVFGCVSVARQMCILRGSSRRQEHERGLETENVGKKVWPTEEGLLYGY